ncbi:tyrosine-type recombinase/integrase [Massilia phyllosphaerae]|uniref:tyrosine-type recombinase/integrase n=1 Tax=Massilia phyllosphaerae TaxID=3106034 RepID=UPI002B1CB451|nr:site-specific integrase [Massilia sp. SGZ-792]
MVIDEEAKIIEPALLYLRQIAIRRGPRHKKLNTANAFAYDLRDWFDYLTHVQWTNPVTNQLEVGKPWDVAGESDYIAYRDTAQVIVSYKTNRELASSTISRRQGTVERFYAYAKKQGWYTGEFIVNKVKKGRVTLQNDLGGQRSSKRSSGDDGTKSQSRETSEFGEPVRPLSAIEWQLIQEALGPLPTQRGDDWRPSRNRVVCELAIGTGMRVDELASLTVYQLQGLHKLWLLASEEMRKDGFFPLAITKTKRLKPRTVQVPGYQIPELMAYMDGEREESIKNGQAHAFKNGQRYKRPVSLFVNDADSAQHCGKAVRAPALSWAFKQACMAADITHLVEKIDIETGERYHEKLVRHRFHDLRHTFAVWKYHSEKADGNAEPWKEIQILLGHSSLKTTLDIYLAIIDVHRRNAGKKQYEVKKRMGEDHAD